MYTLQKGKLSKYMISILEIVEMRNHFYRRFHCENDVRCF